MADFEKFDKRLSRAVAHFWQTRSNQSKKQLQGKRKDQGARSAVTGGAHMDGFIEIIADIITEAGMDNALVHRNKALELPGYFRPTKEWDLLVIDGAKLRIVLHHKDRLR
jgi:hypothetical protein